SDVIRVAKEGVYPLDRVAALPAERLRNCFQKGTGAHAGKAIVKAHLRAAVTFRVLNLLHQWPMHGPFDVIFCRNVMIYFDQATRERLICARRLMSRSRVAWCRCSRRAATCASVTPSRSTTPARRSSWSAARSTAPVEAQPMKADGSSSKLPRALPGFESIRRYL